MVLEHQLTACYAAGSLGGTLGRLNDSLGRLSRAQCTGSREKPGGEAVRASDGRPYQPAEVAHLNQTLRLMADAWASKVFSSRRFDHIENLLDSLKENALDNLRAARKRTGQHLEYQVLAQTLDRLKADELDSM